MPDGGEPTVSKEVRNFSIHTKTKTCECPLADSGVDV